MRWKVPAAVVLLAVGAGAVVLAVSGGPGGSRASSPQYLTATAATADMADTVVANGSLVRATTWALNFGIAPSVAASSDSAAAGNGTWSVTAVKVKVGDVVKKGDVLAVADTSSLRRDLSAARSNLAAARSQRTIAGPVG
jgi:macrolide-specific efflux system membrane fusion protein